MNFFFNANFQNSSELWIPTIYFYAHLAENLKICAYLKTDYQVKRLGIFQML